MRLSCVMGWLWDASIVAFMFATFFVRLGCSGFCVVGFLVLGLRSGWFGGDVLVCGCHSGAVLICA